MVAREPTDRRIERSEKAEALLVLWQRLLTSLITVIQRSIRSIASRSLMLLPRAARLRHQVRGVLLGEPRTEDAPAPTTIAIVSLCGGVLLALLAGLATGGGINAAAGATVGALWVVARLLVMRTVAPKESIEADAITDSWAAGAIPYAFAAFAPLRIIAWLCGIYFTLRSLEKAGVGRSVARSVTAWGYGAEALGVIVAWLARNMLVAAVFSG